MERNKARKILHKARHQYEHKIASGFKTNPKSFCEYIKGKKITTTSINKLKGDMTRYLLMSMNLSIWNIKGQMTRFKRPF